MEQEHLIFLSYASPDQARVQEFYDFLKAKDLQVWMDKHEIRGGQNWDFEIKKALKRAAIIVVFLSNSSVDRRGYAQREIRIALDQAKSKLIDDIYVIPVALDPLPAIPAQFEEIHIIKTDQVDGNDELAKAIVQQLEDLGEIHQQSEQSTGFRWSRETLSENWEGLPGYDFTHDVLRITSTEFPEVSKISDILRGRAAEQLLQERRLKFSQSPDIFNFGQDKYRRQNSTEAHCREPIITGRVLSLIYDISWYGAGAAHPNHGFATYNFVTDPLMRISRLEEIFDHSENAISVIQTKVRQALMQPLDDDGTKLDERDVINGTSKWEDFQSFAFTNEGILVLFDPYHVGPYAYGSHSALVLYREVVKLFQREFVSALQLEYEYRN